MKLLRWISGFTDASRDPRRTRLLLHPLFLCSLTVLIINDHIIKDLYRSFLTGKLSDFAGILMFPVFLAALRPMAFRTSRRLLWLQLFVAGAFVAWKLAPVEMILDQLQTSLSIPVPSRVKDPSDLLALAMLPISFRFLQVRLRIGQSRYSYSALTQLATASVLLIAGWSVMATTRIMLEPTSMKCCQGIRGDANGNGFISVGDMSYLVAYLYHDGPAPPCIAEADVDASGDKNPVREDDLWYLIAYLFENGPPPEPCPDFIEEE